MLRDSVADDPFLRKEDEDEGTESNILGPKAVMAMLAMCNMLNYLDRGIIPGAPGQFETFVHETLGIDSTEEAVYIGYLTSAFIASYAIAITIVSNLVHRFKPFRIMAIGLGLWCLAVFLSGLARSAESFWLLLFARALSGVGEASFQVRATGSGTPQTFSKERSPLSVFLRRPPLANPPPPPSHRFTSLSPPSHPPDPSASRRRSSTTTRRRSRK
jgi:hypothetical protein